MDAPNIGAPVSSDDIRKMKRKMPIKIYLRVAVGFFFSLLIIWYFSYRLLFPILLQFFSLETSTGVTFVISFLVCSLLVKPSLQKEMEKVDEPFSIVARNPDLETPKEKLTIKSVLLRCSVALSFTFLASLPLSIIGILKLLQSKDPSFLIVFSLLDNYKYIYVLFLLGSLFLVFFGYSSLQKWHWTKHQFR